MGLVRKPFAPDAGNRFFFSYPALEQALSVLRRLIQGKESVTLVIGESGSGKTTFLNAYLKTAEENWQGCKIKASKVGSERKKSVRKAGKRKQAFICRDASLPVIIIDDVHQLTKPELKSLFRDAYNPRSGDRGKRLVLFGEPAINATVTEIADSEGGHFSISRIHLPSLSEEETASYLNHRMTAAGYDGKPIFKSAVARQIYKTSGGLPSEINRAAHSWLISQYRISETPLRRRQIFPRIKPFWAILAVICFAIFAFIGILNFRQPRQIEIAAIDSRQKSVQPPNRVARNIESESKRAPAINSKKPLPDRQSNRTDAAPAELLKPSFPSQPLPVLASPGHYKRLRLTEKQVQRETWLMAQESSGYTIQLIGVRNEQSLLDFIKQQNLPEKQPMAYYRTVYRGNSWYPLLYGVYPTAQQARKAIESLPETIRGMNPWIRRLSAIQKAISKHSGLASSR